MTEAIIRQYRLDISGRVQGVGFRASATRKARSLELSGWVRNNEDGSVTTVIQGEESACHRFIAWCREGTGYSWVRNVEVKEQDPSSDLQGYSIRY